MPYNGTGVFNRIYQWVQDAANGIFVDATRTDTDSNDIAAGLTNCVTRDGQSPWLANIPAGGFKITGLAAGVNTTDSTNYTQVFNSPAFNSPTIVTDPALTDNSSLIPSTRWVNQKAFQAALPAQTLGFLRSDGTNAAFTQTHTGYAQNEVKGADIASAPNINLTTATGNLVHVTGTTNITAITIPSGAERTVVFDGILTLVNSASLILPSNANITTAAGDTMRVRGDGLNARVVSYETFTGRALVVTTPGLVKIAGPTTPAAAATADFLSLFSGTYDNYRIIIDGITPAADDSLVLRVAVSNAADSTSNYYGGLVSGTVITAAASSAPITGGTTTTAGSGACFTIDILNANDSVRAKTIVASGASQRNATPGFIVTQQNTQFNRANVLTGFQLLWATASNFSAVGTITVYGYSKV